MHIIFQCIILAYVLRPYKSAIFGQVWWNFACDIRKPWSPREYLLGSPTLPIKFHLNLTTCFILTSITWNMFPDDQHQLFIISVIMLRAMIILDHYLLNIIKWRVQAIQTMCSYILFVVLRTPVQLTDSVLLTARTYNARRFVIICYREKAAILRMIFIS